MQTGLFLSIGETLNIFKHIQEIIEIKCIFFLTQEESTHSLTTVTSQIINLHRSPQSYQPLTTLPHGQYRDTLIVSEGGLIPPLEYGCLPNNQAINHGHLPPQSKLEQSILLHLNLGQFKAKKVAVPYPYEDLLSVPYTA